MIDWKPIDSAPQDGTLILGYRKNRYDEHFAWCCRWITEAEAAEQDGSTNPDDYLSGWVADDDKGDFVSPHYWTELNTPSPGGDE